jgi:hypothetical protein
MRDRRRFGVVTVRRINAETYWLEIDGVMWSEVEWSPSRQRWCIQDAAGHCLTHVEHIIGQDRDVQTAIRLAKRMIVDGRMPSPEEARAQLEAEAELERERNPKRKTKPKPKPKPKHEDEHEYLGEPFTMDVLPEPVLVIGNRHNDDEPEAA